MADPKIALASIGKVHRARTGPPQAIQAIQNDLIKVNFDPSKAAAKLARLVHNATTKSSKLVLTPTTSNIDTQDLEEEARMEMKKLNDPIRNSLRSRCSLNTPKRSGTLIFAASKKSSLLITANKNSSLELSRNTTSTGTPVSSKRARKGERKLELLPHGFRYHSNGDERVSRSSSISISSISSANLQATKATNSFSELAKLRANIAHFLPRSFKAKTGINFCNGPKLEEQKMSGQFHMPCRISNEPVIGSRGNASCSIPTRDNDTMFKRTILRHIQDMAQSKESVSRASLTRGTSALNEKTVTDRDPLKTTESSLGHALNHSVEYHGDSISAANSSFNMRYGVPVKLMAQRKHMLDEKFFEELEEVHKNNAQIDKFLTEIKRVTKTGQAQAYHI